MLDEARKEGCPNYGLNASEIDHVAYYKYYHKLDCLMLIRGL